MALVIAAAGPAHAYHNGAVFDRASGAGGAGGLFYTGAPRERGWDCTSCHVDPTNRLRLDVSSTPPGLVDGVYEPGTAYTVTVAFADPAAQLGLPATRSNYNAIGASFTDADGMAVGMISGFDPTRFYARGTSILASDSTVVNETTWSFVWTAPATGAGRVTLYLAAVDGAGAGQQGTTTLTDPLGDDVALEVITAAPSDAAVDNRTRPWRGASYALIVGSLLVIRRRRPGRPADTRAAAA